jgi:peptidoglycan/LPS O-acetylase OafA/YrhL
MNKSLPIAQNNIQVIDLVRSLAIFSVLARHLADALPTLQPSEKLVWNWVTSNSGGGVMMFLVVSGFLITRIIDLSPGGLFKPNWKNFYVRRVARIIPLYLLQVFGGILVLFSLIYFFGENSRFFIYCFKLPRDGSGWSFWLSLFTFSFNWVEAFKYDEWQQVGVYWVLLWSLAVEEQFYIFYPFYLRVLGNTRQLVLALITLVFVCLFWKFNFPSDWPSTTLVAVQGNIHAYGEIALGALLYLACKEWGAQLLLKKKLCLFFSLIGAGFIVFSYCPYDWGAGYIKPMVIGGGVFLFLLGGIHLRLFESKNLKIFALSGKYSYASYLFHIAILYLVEPSLIHINAFLALSFYVVATTTVAFVYYRVFEFPMNNLIRGWFKIALKSKET